MVFLKAPKLRFRRKLAPTPGKFGIITFLQDPIAQRWESNFPNSRRFCELPLRKWLERCSKAPAHGVQRPSTCCASHAREEGSHCFTITSTGRRASSVRSLSTEQRQLLTAERHRTRARMPRGPAPRQRVRNARLSARREFKACEGARPGVSGGVMGGLRRRHVTTTPRLTFDARRARRARRMICSSIMSLGLSVRPSWTEICELDVDGRCSRPTASASMIAHVELTVILSPVPART